MTYEEQLDAWVNGIPVHKHDTDECCPDFSCCVEGIETPKEEKEKLQKAYRDKDWDTVNRMLMGFLKNMLGKQEMLHKAHIVEGV